MAEVEAAVEIPSPLAEVWELYFDPERWPSWVDGFERVTDSDGYPTEGGTLSWQSNAAGRGAVCERVLAHEPRSRHRVRYADPGSEGELTTRFEMAPAAGEERVTVVAQTLRYRIRRGGVARPVLDLLFVRPQMRRSLERSLANLRMEATQAR